MSAHGLVGTVEISIVYDVHLREVILALAHAEQLSLEESHGRVAPAGTGTILILNRGNGVLLHGGEYESLILFRILCESTEGHQTSERKCKESFCHIF